MEGVSNLSSLALGGDSVFHSNLSLALSLKAKCESLPAFYSEVIKQWEKFSVCSKLTAEQILSEQLWNHKFILSNSKSIDYPALKTKGLALVRDLFSKDGSARTWESISQGLWELPVYNILRPTRQHKYQLWHHNYLIVALLQIVLPPLCITHQVPYLYLTP